MKNYDRIRNIWRNIVKTWQTRIWGKILEFKASFGFSSYVNSCSKICFHVCSVSDGRNTRTQYVMCSSKQLVYNFGDTILKFNTKCLPVRLTCSEVYCYITSKWSKSKFLFCKRIWRIISRFSHLLDDHTSWWIHKAVNVRQWKNYGKHLRSGTKTKKCKVKNWKVKR